MRDEGQNWQRNIGRRQKVESVEKMNRCRQRGHLLSFFVDSFVNKRRSNVFFQVDESTKDVSPVFVNSFSDILPFIIDEKWKQFCPLSSMNQRFTINSTFHLWLIFLYQFCPLSLTKVARVGKEVTINCGSLLSKP